MKLYTFYTDTHESMLDDYLRKSINYFGEFDIITKKGQQISDDGSFYSKGFHDTVIQKISFLLDEVNWASEEVCVFSDTDIIITKPCKDFFLEQIQEYDIVFQSDQTSMNTGFFVFRCNNKVKALLEKSLSLVDKHFGDQLCVNAALKDSDVKYKAFDKTVFNVGFYLKGKLWNGEDTIHFPKRMRVFHANFMVGLEAKRKALEKARERFLKDA